MIKISDYRELYIVSWSIDRDSLTVDEETAYGLYQAGWRHVHLDQMGEQEWSLLRRLVEQYGPIQPKFMGREHEAVTLDDLERLRRGAAMKTSKLLWGFVDSTRLVIVDAETARDALTKAEKHWLVGQTITPIGVLPLNAPELVEKNIYPFDPVLWHSRNEFFFDCLKSPDNECEG